MKNQLPIMHGIMLISIFSSHDMALMAQNVPSLKLENLRVENQANPIGIDERQPRLSWQIVSSQRGVRQKAYQIRAAETSAALGQDRGLIWDTGKTASEQSVHVVYQGPALQSRQRLYWQVRVWRLVSRLLNLGHAQEFLWRQTGLAASASRGL